MQVPKLRQHIHPILGVSLTAGAGRRSSEAGRGDDERRNAYDPDSHVPRDRSTSSRLCCVVTKQIEMQ